MVWSLVGIGAVCLGCSAWLVSTALQVRTELEAAEGLVSVLTADIAAADQGHAANTVGSIREHTSRAKDAVDQPLWTLASTVPFLGPNFSAAAEVARSADDVVDLGLRPLADVYASLKWESLLPNSSGMDLRPLKASSPAVSGAASAVTISADRLNQIDATKLLPQVAEPLKDTRKKLEDVTGALNAAADASRIAPQMMGVEGSRRYLLMVQNNAELRASGGIAGALAVLNIDNGKLTLGSQSSAGALGTMAPTLPVDAEQQQIYSVRLGKYMQDVNLTPDFPSAAKTAQAMWKRGTGEDVDGVLSIDPIALGYLLHATGPVSIADPELAAKVTTTGLPAQLTAENVVKTLLSDVYAKIEQPNLQDAYFASVAQEVFSALSTGKGDAAGVMKGITRATQEGRISIWSADREEQNIISTYPVGGAVAGPSVLPAQFGVYFNDGTGAKMDYYIKRTVQLIQECPANDYSQTTVRVTSTNTAPSDAATSLPAYVTGGGAFGIPPGTVQTNVTAYGPVQANLAGASQGGQNISVSSHRHDGRPVGTTTVTLAPGETSTVDIQFNKIVQHASPEVRVTPTVQDVRDVILATESATCAPAG